MFYVVTFYIDASNSRLLDLFLVFKFRSRS